EDEDAAGSRAACADAQLRLFAAERPRADAADSGAEAAGGGQHVAAEGHVRADQVADARTFDGHPAVRAPDDPVELGRETRGPPALPGRLGGAADSEHVRVRVRLREPLEPVVGRRTDPTAATRSGQRSSV